MKQFDVCQLAHGDELVVNVQSDLLGDLKTLMFVPLLTPNRAPEGHPRLLPVLGFDGRDFVFATPLLASVPKRYFAKNLGSLTEERDRITAALDFLFQGF